MNVLCDRHQADLFYAMQLLFEDWLGMTVYTPIGHDWWDEGYWRFGEGWGDDRLARQFLNMAGWSNPYFIYLNHDPHHPQRQIQGVTLEQAQAMDWAYVVATVPDNEQGFYRFATEHGAQYVVQVGNTRQLVNWGLDPLALVSSEVEIRGRGVVIHQPFDYDTTFRFRDPSEAMKRFSSFVNLMPRLPDWPMWEDYRHLLGGWETKVYGIDGYDGNLEPVGAIADAMAESAFGLHLKPTGDGFGHILHNWAAVGRPLVGRASYYRGQMGERFWQDGVTCVDLDLRDPVENVRLINDIWNDRPRYEAMCRAITLEFDKIDWAGEARAVRELLDVKVAA